MSISRLSIASALILGMAVATPAFAEANANNEMGLAAESVNYARHPAQKDAPFTPSITKYGEHVPSERGSDK